MEKAEASNLVSLVEHQHLTEMHETLRRRLIEAQKKERVRIDHMRSRVLTSVVTENYDRAKDEIKNYVGFRSQYPGFQDRAERYVNHCCDLVVAIQTKRSFPGLASLSLSKQQEIHEKVLQHFEELKQNLKHIERVEREHRLMDIRSTVWVLRTLCQVVAAVTAVAFILDMQSGLLSSFFHVANLAVDDASTWVVNLIKF